MSAAGVSHPADAACALVLGACGGLGLAVARRLGREARIILADIDDRKAALTADMLSGEGYSASALHVDVGDADSVAAMCAAASQLGRVQIVAHVVGLSPSCGDWRQILRVNATGAALVAELVAPLLARGSAAVFVSSLGGHIIAAPPAIVEVLDMPLASDFSDRIVAAHEDFPTPSVAYGWSKIALMRMCRRLAPSWGKCGRRINSLSPGLIASPMGEREFAAEPRKAGMMGQIPLGRQANLIEVADVLAFLCSKRAGYITGTDLLMDGGLAAALWGHPISNVDRILPRQTHTRI